MATSRAPRNGARSQLWSTFVRNHATAVLACDFFVVVTATFRVFYVFVVLESQLATDPPLECDRTSDRRMDGAAVPDGDVRRPHRFLIHDHDCIYSDRVDRTIAAMGPTILKTPVRSAQANAFCERVMNTIRRECLDWMMPFNEGHLRRVLRWAAHYNRGRPHTSLGPGMPDARDLAPVAPGHRIRDGHRVVAMPILGGLHHEYHLESRAA